LVARYRAQGAGIFFGDASHPDLLRKFHIDRAAALVVTMDSAMAAERVVSGARRDWPGITIYARARDQDHATRLIALGANHVIPETIEASLKLSEMVLVGAGLPHRAASSAVDARRQAEQAVVDESKKGEGD
jgi:CPA2 family monovalent cation:H+ antiporter-2